MIQIRNIIFISRLLDLNLTFRPIILKYCLFFKIFIYYLLENSNLFFYFLFLFSKILTKDSNVLLTTFT